MYYPRVPSQKICFDCVENHPAKKVCVYGPDHNLAYKPHYKTGEITWLLCESCGHVEVKVDTMEQYLKTAIEHAKAEL